jgi:putative salt-induced outer membrane protein YdiY
MKIRIAMIAVVLSCALPRIADAQIVNVQSVLATEAKEGLSGSVKGSANWRTGNIDLLRLSGLATAAYHQGDNLVIAIVKGDFGKAKGARFIAKTFEHVRYRRELSSLLLAESFVQHEYDQFRRLELRTLAGAGVALRLLRGKKYNLTFGLAYMPEYERLRDDEETDAGNDYFAHRISSYLNGALQLDERIQLVQTFYAQPRADAPSDARYLSESQFVVQISDRLTQTTSFALAYDTRPPIAIDKTDTNLTSSVIFSF